MSEPVKKWIKFCTGEFVSILLDSSFLIALANERDINHSCAVALMKEIHNHEFGQIVITDYVFDETVMYILVRTSAGKAVELGQKLRSAEVQFKHTSELDFENAWALFQQKRNLSFTDCAIVECMKEYAIKYLASFDKGFEQFKEIKLLK